MNRASLRRTVTRFIALYGWKPLGILCACVLLFALVMDHLIAERSTSMERIATLDKKQREMARKIGQQKQQEALLKDTGERLAAARLRGFSAPTPELASAELLNEMQAQIAAVPIKTVRGSALPPSSKDGFTIIQAEGGFEASTEALVTLLEKSAAVPRAIKISQLDVRVIDIEQPALLAARLSVESFYAVPAALPGKAK